MSSGFALGRGELDHQALALDIVELALPGIVWVGVGGAVTLDFRRCSERALTREARGRDPSTVGRQRPLSIFEHVEILSSFCPYHTKA